MATKNQVSDKEIYNVITILTQNTIVFLLCQYNYQIELALSFCAVTYRSLCLHSHTTSPARYDIDLAASIPRRWCWSN